MFCRSCGAKIEEGNKFCTVCGSSVQDNNDNNNITANKEDIKEKTPEEQDAIANKLCWLSLGLTFGFPIIGLFFASLRLTVFTYITSWGPIAGLICLIIARIKYPKNTFSKILLISYIILLIIGIILLILIVKACVSAIRGCA